MNLAALMMAWAVSFGGTTVSAAASVDLLSPLIHGTIVDARALAPVRPNIFGTVALDAGVTPYGARWRRVSAADRNDVRVKALAASAVAAGPNALLRIAAVHTDVGRRIRWQRDLDTYQVSDYWAQAGETLTRGRGDGEDIAIVKMQVLKAAGFSPRDIYLSVGRDRLRGADTLLVVRIGSDFYALDDRSPKPVRALGGARFKPVITFGRNNAWIHGRRIVARALILRSQSSYQRPLQHAATGLRQAPATNDLKPGASVGECGVVERGLRRWRRGRFRSSRRARRSRVPAWHAICGPARSSRGAPRSALRMRDACRNGNSTPSAHSRSCRSGLPLMPGKRESMVNIPTHYAGRIDQEGVARKIQISKIAWSLKPIHSSLVRQLNGDEYADVRSPV